MAATRHASERRAPFLPALLLMALCLLINYVDRGNLSIAAPLLKSELGFSPAELGILLSAFFWTYTIMQFVSGWLVDRFNVSLLIAIGYLVWSLASAATGLVRGFGVLLLMRLLLGISESIAYPGCSKLIAVHVREHRRGVANGVIMASTKFGNAAGIFGAGLLIAKYGWRPVFIIIGLGSLVWLPAWQRWKPTSHAVPHAQEAGSRVIAGILRQRSFWGASIGHFASNYLIYFMMTWLPFYLVRARHLSMATMASTAGLYYLVDAVSAIAIGWISDHWIRAGGTPTLVRKSMMAVGFGLAAVAMGGCAIAGPHTYMAWLLAVAAGSGIGSSGTFCFAQTLAGPARAGRWSGLQNGCANFAGVVGPALTGLVVEKTGSFLAPFGITALVLVAGGLAWTLMVGPVAEICWQQEPMAAEAASA
jgi:ACS family D-galactonate transporter-like MFS transporter